MSERKVLNKYYPPDFDPSKIPRMKLPKNRQYTVRLMAPCNMRCKTCGEYIYKGKKFNARKEDVEGEDYLGIRIYRFYIKCTRCLQEISFKTDPRNTDYEIEAGATRNFMALKLAEEQAQREEDERKEEEASNPMKLLENRTQQSKQELELLESLEELKDLNRRQQSVDYDTMLSQFNNDKEALKRLAEKQEEEDEKFIRSVYGSSSTKRVVEEEVIEDVDFSSSKSSSVNRLQDPPRKIFKGEGKGEGAEIKSEAVVISSNTKPLPSKASSLSWDRSVGIIKGGATKAAFSGLVRKKQAVASTASNPLKAAVSNKSDTASDSKMQSDTKPAPSGNGLSLLGSYSGSDSDN